MEETQLSVDIKKLLIENKCELKTDVTFFTTKSSKITYICSCGIERTQMYKDYIRRDCRTCREKKFKDNDFKEGEIDDIKEESGEIWRRVKGGWLSSFGRCKNVENKLLTLCMDKYRYNIGGKQEYVSRLLSKTFKIKDYQKIEGNQNFIVRFKDWYEPKSKEPEEYDKTINNFRVDNLYIGTKTEIGQENGLKSRQSEIFKDKFNIDIDSYNVSDKVILSFLPNHIICKDGNIYNGSRFLTGSKSEKYLKICTNEKSYPIHRLVCMAFHPIPGKSSYEDYEDLQVNHINGEVDENGLLSNNADNLEWINSSGNMMHSYEQSLNKKQRAVLQYDKTSSILISEYRSIAEASRKTGEQEHQIREIAKGKNNSKANFLWKFKDESKTEEYSKKYSHKAF
jgi:hypothetical protein